MTPRTTAYPAPSARRTGRVRYGYHCGSASDLAAGIAAELREFWDDGWSQDGRAPFLDRPGAGEMDSLNGPDRPLKGGCGW